MVCCRLLTVAFALLPASSALGEVRISQVYGGGGNSGAPYARDFVELFNAGQVPVDLEGWSLQYATATGASWQVTPLQGILEPGAYFLAGQASGGSNGAALPAPDGDGTVAMAASSGKVALVDATTPLLGACPALGQSVDFVGYGAANCFEGAAAVAALSNTTAALRRDGGCADDGDNGADFTVEAPQPRNSASPPLACNAAPTATPTPTPTPTRTSTPTSPPTTTPTRIPTPAPSLTPTLTPTPTPTSTPTPTARATPTPTASPTATVAPSAAACGNGVLEPGEHCDDGNSDDGDLCPSGDGGRCLYTAPGSLAYGHTALRRVRRRGCWLGWHVVQAAGPEVRRGAVHPAQACDDQDPGCDFAPDPGVCEFRVVACLNVSNGDLAQCAPMPIGEVRVHGPRGAARSAEHAANRAALADALAALRAPADATTDPPHAPPLAAHDVDLCSAPFAVRVALDRLPRRSTNLSVRAHGGDDGRLGLSSRLRLTCRR